jgi:para-nitrobenzyl esterase
MKFHMPAIASVALLCATLPLCAIDDPVRVENGPLSGAPGSSPDVKVYKGVPFAAAPVGELRWKGPKPAPFWQGVRAATEFSAACYQSPYPKASIYYRDPEPMSEDCLYLNVWTAAKSNKEHRPVMV